jgi:serine/threonine-protein kinase
MPLTAGSRLGPYEIVAPLGAGGMGQVYRAHDSKLSRDVAIKILPDAVAADPDRLARFEREAKTLAALNHPNIATIYGLEHTPDGQALIMELVEGEDLSEKIEGQRAKGSGLPLDEVLPIAKQIAEALEAAHEQGIIHRDLKPANIKVRPDGTVKVLDFGLAKAAEPAAVGSMAASMSPTITTPAMTQAGMLLGTAAYMSPEQAKGRSVDKRSDIWAFGAVVYEMLAGRRAFDAEDVAETLAAVLMKEPDWTALPPNTPPAVTSTLQRCLVKDRKLRIRDIGDAMLALGGAFETVREPPSAHVAVRPVAIWQRPIAIGAMIAAVASIAVIGAWSLTPRPPASASVAKLTIIPSEPMGSLENDQLVAISPDGREIVYRNITSSSSGQARGGFVRRRLEEYAGTLIETNGANRGDTGPIEPFYSPDGKRVGFIDSLTGQTLQSVPAGGGLPLTIAKTPIRIRGASWDADNHIVFATGSGGLFRVSADGGSPVALATPDAARNEAYQWPSVIRGRAAVLFTIRAAGGTGTDAQIAVLDLSSHVVTRLVQGTAPQYVSTGYLVYAAVDGTLRAVRFDPKTLKTVGTPIKLVEGVAVGSVGGANYALSENGTLVYITGRGSQLQRTLAFIGPSGQREPLKVPADQYLSPRLSPDGKRLAVQTIDERGSGVIWVYEVSGNSQIQQLTFKGDNKRPIWTSDGRRITFASDRDGPSSLYWQPADGSAEAERLTTAAAGEAHFPGSWSPDGILTFMIQRPGNRYSISTLSRTPAGWKTEPLLEGDGRVYLAPEFSPDGKWFAYGSGPIYTSQDLYVEPFPRTGQVIRITRDGGYWPFWTRSTDRLFFRGVSTALGNRLRSVSIETKPAFRFSNESVLPVTDFTVITVSRDYDITPDGKLLMVFPVEQKAAGAGLLNVVLNWTAELEKVGSDAK